LRAPQPVRGDANLSEGIVLDAGVRHGLLQSPGNYATLNFTSHDSPAAVQKT
jgi:hypothetical protein